MSIELEQRVRQLELRLDELQRRLAGPLPPAEEATAVTNEPSAKSRRRDTTGRFAR